MTDKEKRLVRIPAPEKSLTFLYKNKLGRTALKLLTARPVSELAGWFLDSRLSKAIIPGFIKKNGIDLAEYEYCDYRSFNEFFCRRIKSGLRNIDKNKEHLISPCDGLLSVYRIHDGLVVPVKKSRYSISRLLNNEGLAKSFDDGYCLVFRLCVNHYHRYCYPDKGYKGENHFIKGRLHTVRPIALENGPVFTENCREYTLVQTENFGDILQMEVGAMLVGKIDNYHGPGPVLRGQEKGRFLYGGSTIILLIQKDKIELPNWFLQTEKDEFEIAVKMGECIGYAKKTLTS